MSEMEGLSQRSCFNVITVGTDALFYTESGRNSAHPLPSITSIYLIVRISD